MCVFYVVVIRMFGSIFLVCGYFFWSHCYVNVCAFAWILILFLIVHFIMKIFRECIVNVSLFSLSLIAEFGVYILSFVGMECT